MTDPICSLKFVLDKERGQSKLVTMEGKSQVVMVSS